MLIILLLCLGPLVSLRAQTPPVTNPNAVPDESAFFQLLDLQRPDLNAVKTAVDAHDWPAAKRAWAQHLDTRPSPHWLWSRQDKVRILQLETAQFGGLASYVPAAEKVLTRQFAQPQFRRYPAREVEWHEGTNEYTTALNRMTFWLPLGRAYWATGDMRYSTDFVFLLNDWIAANPVPPDAHQFGDVKNSGWRTLDTGLRIMSWLETMPYFMGAPPFDPEAKYRMTKSLAEQARYLYQKETEYGVGNWQVAECTGLVEIGIMFPEFRDAAQWRSRAFTYLVQHMQKDVEPDGMDWEMTPGYHTAVMEDYIAVSRLCQLNGFTVPGLLDRHEKMFEALMKLSEPDRRLPPLGDAGKADILTTIGEGALLYHRPDMRFLAADKPSEKWIWMFGPSVIDEYPKLPKRALTFTSTLLPNAQYAMMRTGWTPGDKYLLLDGAPFQGEHNHLDALQVLVYAGRDLLIDPGQYNYNGPLAGAFRTTEAHNVLTIDALPQPRVDPTLLSWDTGPNADFAADRISENGVVHQRSVVFVKPDYWIVVDTVTGSGVHALTRLFHMPLDSAPQADAVSVRTAFATGMNLQILPADGPDMTTHLDMRTSPVPTGRLTAAPGPVAAFVTKTTLPATLCTVLTPFADAKNVPTQVQRIAVNDPTTIHLKITFADGQQDDVTVASGPTLLAIDGKKARGYALAVRHGPRANSATVLGMGTN